MSSVDSLINKMIGEMLEGRPKPKAVPKAVPEAALKNVEYENQILELKLRIQELEKLNVRS